MEEIRGTGVPAGAPVIDVGAGVSSLVDLLLESDYNDISVLDISSSAIDRCRSRLGDAASRVNWLQADVLQWAPPKRYRLWHDRAVFHFMIGRAQADKYLDTMRAALEPGGFFILSTFGPDGPGRCSGLDVQRYSIDRLSDLLEDDFELRSCELEFHTTPAADKQQFLHSCWQMTG
jgi:SAM-dependent methyltransferase